MPRGPLRARPARHPQEPPASPSSRSPLLNLEPPAFPNPRRGGATHSIRAPDSHTHPGKPSHPLSRPKTAQVSPPGPARRAPNPRNPNGTVPGSGLFLPMRAIPSQPNGRLVPPSHELRHHFPFYRTPTLSTPTRRKQPASLARCTLHSPGRLDEATWKRGWKG